MPKRRKLFSVKNNDKNIDMNVDEALYNHFQSLTPLEQKRIQDLMTLKLFQEINE
jgi:predicted choloylglycine hydrolase